MGLRPTNRDENRRQASGNWDRAGSQAEKEAGHGPGEQDRIEEAHIRQRIFAACPETAFGVCLQNKPACRMRGRMESANVPELAGNRSAKRSAVGNACPTYSRPS